MAFRAFNEWWESFISILYPNLCWACDEVIYHRGEGICPSCALTLPYTHFHENDENPVHKAFWGRVPVKGATALYYFNQKTRVQRLIHRLKYKGKTEIGMELGRILGKQLKDKRGFETVDAVLPVPLHPAKKIKRGYNQAEMVSAGIAEAMEIGHFPNGLKRTRNTSTQTKKSRMERVKNMEGVFVPENPAQLYNKHLLIVDDVITTGSTLEACANVLLTIPETRVSIATLAFAQ